MTDPYRLYGIHHGTAFFYDADKPDSDAFLAHMERWLPAHGIEAYLDGFCDGMLGDHRREYPWLRGLSKVGSNNEVVV